MGSDSREPGMINRTWCLESRRLMVVVSLHFFFNLLDAVVVRCMSGVVLHALNTFENQHSLVAQAARNLPAVWETWV